MKKPKKPDKIPGRHSTGFFLKIKETSKEVSFLSSHEINWK